MRKALAIVVVIVAAVVLWSWPYPPWFTERQRLIARAQRLGSATFTPDGWSAADARVRATMVADLLRGHDFLGRRHDTVTELLGPSTCYADYEDMPCYLVEVSGGARQRLVFGVNHSDRPGTVIDVSFWDH
jgi:hypothetical protein